MRTETSAQKFALLVGIDRYQGGIECLKNAVGDVRAVAKVLTELHGYQVQVVEDEQATLASLPKLLRDLSSKLSPDTRFIFYFAGHGVAEDLFERGDGNEGFLLLSDTDRDDPKSFWPMADVKALLGHLPCQHLLLILDCCFAGAFRSTLTRNVANRQRTLYRERYERYLRDPGWQVLTSTAYDEKALDVVRGWVLGSRGEASQNSPFAAALCEGLRGAADLSIGGEPGDGVILVTELHLYLEDRLKKLEYQLGHRVQRPMLLSLPERDKGEFIFETPGRSPSLPVALALNEQNNPYRGLEPYQEAHSKLFFGRAEQVRLLCARVCEQALTVVTGPSGVGKSSLVFAGLLPRLREMTTPAWHIVTPIRPGREPLRALASVSEELGQLNASLDEAVATWCKREKKRHLLLVIDQLEEVVSLGASEEQLTGFFSALRNTLRGNRVHAVLTLRADFEPHFEDLFDSWGQSYLFLPPMRRNELREAIELPASERVLYFEPPQLIERLLDEVSETPGALPLLSFTLSELYRAYVQSGRNDRSLRLEDYEAIGGIAGALSRRADQIYNELDQDHQASMERLLLRMIAIQSGEIARRQVPLSELDYGPESEEQRRLQTVLQQLLAARLVVSGKDGEGTPYVEPAHDKVILGWRRLRELLKREYDNLVLHRRMTQAAVDWHRAKRSAEWLWTGDPRLPLLQNPIPERLNTLEQDFLNNSRNQIQRNQLQRKIGEIRDKMTEITMLLAGKGTRPGTFSPFAPPKPIAFRKMDAMRMWGEVDNKIKELGIELEETKFQQMSSNEFNKLFLERGLLLEQINKAK